MIGEYLFKLLIIFLPVQLGRHFWFSESLVSGIRIDYLSPTIYLTDILLIALLFVYRKRLMWKKEFFLILLPFFISSLLAPAKIISFYRFLKILEAFLFILFIIRVRPKFPLWPLCLSILYSSFLAFAQFANHGSLGGIFWFLGERSFRASTPGIALFSFGGTLFLRPYATFPHPNVLGGYLAVLLPLLFLKKEKLSFWQEFFFFFCFFAGVGVLILSFSRSAWLVFILALTLILLKEKKISHFFAGFLLISYPLFFMLRDGFFLDESYFLRIELARIALKMIVAKPVFGVGLGNFVPRIPEFKTGLHSFSELQPVHNVYLLMLSEIGFSVFLPLIVFFKRIKKYFLAKKGKIVFSLALFGIFILCFFDHYFYTLQQGILLWSLIFGYWVLAHRKNEKDI